MGIGPSAIRDACILLDVPRRKWPHVTYDVSFMGATVAESRNKRASKAAER